MRHRVPRARRRRPATWTRQASRPGSDDAEVIAHDVRQRQRRRQAWRGCREPAAFDQRQVLAQRVQLVNVGAGQHEGPRRGLFVLEPEPLGGFGHQRRCPAGDQHHEVLARTDGPGPAQRFARRLTAPRVGKRMTAGDEVERRRHARHGVGTDSQRRLHSSAGNAISAVAIAGAALPAATMCSGPCSSLSRASGSCHARATTRLADTPSKAARITSCKSVVRAGVSGL